MPSETNNGQDFSNYQAFIDRQQFRTDSLQQLLANENKISLEKAINVVTALNYSAEQNVGFFTDVPNGAIAIPNTEYTLKITQKVSSLNKPYPFFELVHTTSPSPEQAKDSEQLPQRVEKIFVELIEAVKETNNPRFVQIMADQIQKAKDFYKKLPPEERDNYDILIHGTSNSTADKIREIGYFSPVNYPTVFTHLESALEGPKHVDQTPYKKSNENQKVQDMRDYFDQSGNAAYIETNFGDDWDVVVMVVPRDFHQGAVITHTAAEGPVDKLTGYYTSLRTERLRWIPQQYILSKTELSA